MPRVLVRQPDQHGGHHTALASWLCVPAFRRVCLYRDPSRERVPSHSQDAPAAKRQHKKKGPLSRPFPTGGMRLDVKAAHRILRGQRAFDCALLSVVFDRQRFLSRASQSTRVGNCQRNGHAVIAALRIVVRYVRTRHGARCAITERPLVARYAPIIPRCRSVEAA